MRTRGTDKVWNDERRKMLIGLFFEGLIHTVLGGSRKGLARRFRRADMIHWLLDALVEVKAVDNGHRPTTFLDQFESHLKLLGFPLSHILYFICCYKVKVNDRGNSRSELAENTPTERELEHFLAKHVTEVFVLHHSLLQNILGLGKRGQRRGRETIPISRTEIREMASDVAELRKLGLQSRRVQIQKRFRGLRIRFQLTMICPPQIITKIKRLIKSHNRKEKK